MRAALATVAPSGLCAFKTSFGSVRRTTTLAASLARDLPTSRLMVIADCGHEPHEEHLDKVIAAQKKFEQKTGDPTMQLRKLRMRNRCPPILAAPGKPACFSSPTTSTTGRPRKKPSIIPAGPRRQCGTSSSGISKRPVSVVVDCSMGSHYTATAFKHSVEQMMRTATKQVRGSAASSSSGDERGKSVAHRVLPEQNPVSPKDRDALRCNFLSIVALSNAIVRFVSDFRRTPTPIATGV